MKKLLLGMFLTLAMAGAAFAQGQAHDNTGCGLGTMLWENRANGSTLLQAFQATTNGSSGTQTFGITSGTSGCQRPSKFVQNEKLIEFVQANMDNLAKDMAMGKGETLDTFAEMLGVPADQRVVFNAKMQANFNQVFPSDHVVLAQVIDNALTVANN